MEKFINTSEIIWPNRFDLLVRIDFLEWFETVGIYYLPKSNLGSITKNDLLISNRKFLDKAKQHPYFIQYTKLKRGYRLRNLTYKEAEDVYVEGIANFIKLKEDIKANSLNLKKRITLKKPLFNIKSASEHTTLRKHYIGDGCHRFACLAWLRKEFLMPNKFFRFSYRLSYNPAYSNLTAGYRLLGILREEDIKHFKIIFEGTNIPKWDSTLQWISEIRERFGHMDQKLIFKVKFKNLYFNDIS